MACHTTEHCSAGIVHIAMYYLVAECSVIFGGHYLVQVESVAWIIRHGSQPKRFVEEAVGKDVERLAIVPLNDALHVDEAKVAVAVGAAAIEYCIIYELVDGVFIRLHHVQVL